MAYQMIAGQRVAVEARYTLADSDRVSLTLGRYDAAEALIIDPVLGYSTFWAAAASTSAMASRWMPGATPTSRGLPIQPIFRSRTRSH